MLLQRLSFCGSASRPLKFISQTKSFALMISGSVPCYAEIAGSWDTQHLDVVRKSAATFIPKYTTSRSSAPHWFSAAIATAKGTPWTTNHAQLTAVKEKILNFAEAENWSFPQAKEILTNKVPHQQKLHPLKHHPSPYSPNKKAIHLYQLQMIPRMKHFG